MRRHRRYYRWIDRYLVDELPRRHHEPLLEHVRACDDCRSHYDRSVDALRMFEGVDNCSPGELDRVMTRLLGEPTPRSATVPRWLGFLSTFTAAAAVAAVVLWIRPDDDGFVARGRDDDTAFGIQAMCGQPLRAADDGCNLDEALTFAYWVDSKLATDRHVVLFGVDGAGDVLYYAPTPADPPLLAERGAWEPAEFAIELAVNHEPGAVRIYGLVPPPNVVPTIDNIDQWAAALADADSARTGDLPWFRRLTPELMATTCPDVDDCQSVELSIMLQKASR